MGMKRYIAGNMQLALREIRLEQGADAVILSTRKVPGGVEVICSTAEQAVRCIPSAPHPGAAAASPAASAQRSANPEMGSAPGSGPLTRAIEAAGLGEHLQAMDRSAQEFGSRKGGFTSPSASSTSAASVASARTAPAPAPVQHPSSVLAPSTNFPAEQGDAATRQAVCAMQEELRALRRIVESLPRAEAIRQPEKPRAIGGSEPPVAANDVAAGSKTRNRRAQGPAESLSPAETPARAVTPTAHIRGSRRDSAGGRLAAMGFSPAACARIVGQAADQSLGGIQTGLAKCLRNPEGDLMEHRGCTVFVGPPGAGKTTTLAKVAARHVLRYGKQSIALVSLDRYRLGANQQMHALGRLLDVPVVQPALNAALDDVLDGLADRRLVLVDTAGLTPGGPDWAEQVRHLETRRHVVTRCLVMPATSQTAVLTASYRAWATLGVDVCIATKLDEAIQPGSVFSLPVEHAIPLAFIADGQCISSDLHRLDPARLVTLIEALWQDSPANPEGSGAEEAYEQDWVV